MECSQRSVCPCTRVLVKYSQESVSLFRLVLVFLGTSVLKHPGISEAFIGVSVPVHIGVTEVFTGISVPLHTGVNEVFTGISMFTFGLEQIEEKNDGKSQESPQPQSL